MAMYLVLFPIIFTYAAAVLGNKETKQDKANYYLMYKWGLFHNLNDINKDGLLSSADAELLKQYYAGLDSVGAEKRNFIAETIDQLWEETFFAGKPEVTEDEFVEMMKKRYESNKTQFIQTLRKADKKWFKAVDLDGDHFLSKNESILDLAGAKHCDKIKDKAFFKSHKLVHCRLSIAEAVKVYLRFQTEEDHSKTDIILRAIKSDIKC